MQAQKTYVAAWVVAGLHLVGVLGTTWYVGSSAAGQAPMVWVLWTLIDLPVSLAFDLIEAPLALLHGSLGTAWWFALVAILIKAHRRSPPAKPSDTTTTP